MAARAQLSDLQVLERLYADRTATARASLTPARPRARALRRRAGIPAGLSPSGAVAVLEHDDHDEHHEGADSLRAPPALRTRSTREGTSAAAIVPATGARATNTHAVGARAAGPPCAAPCCPS